MESTTLINSWPLALVKTTAENAVSFRLQLIKLIAFTLMFQEMNGIHIVLGMGIWRFEGALTLEMWDG